MILRLALLVDLLFVELFVLQTLLKALRLCFEINTVSMVYLLKLYSLLFGLEFLFVLLYPANELVYLLGLVMSPEDEKYYPEDKDSSDNQKQPEIVVLMRWCHWYRDLLVELAYLEKIIGQTDLARFLIFNTVCPDICKKTLQNRLLYIPSHYLQQSMWWYQKLAVLQIVEFLYLYVVGVCVAIVEPADCSGIAIDGQQLYFWFALDEKFVLVDADLVDCGVAFEISNEVGFVVDEGVLCDCSLAHFGQCDK